MNDILIGLLILAATSLLPITAYRSNLRSDASWERMRRELTPQWYLQTRHQNQYAGVSMEVKTFYSQRLLDRLVPSLKHASDSGYTHMFLPPKAFNLTPDSVNYLEHPDIIMRHNLN